MDTKPSGACMFPGVMSSDDRETFERVWRRVMPEPREDCPITLLTGENADTPAVQPAAAANQATNNGEAGTELSPVWQMPGEQNLMGEAVRGDFPSAGFVPCLGAGALECIDVLQELIRDEVQDWRYYQALARKVGGSAARVFADLSADEKHHAKRLAAAYFLISGIRFWPEQNKKINIGSYLQALRERFIGEQNGVAAYLTAAASCTDPCLRRLYLENAEDEADHACQIRSLVEQL